MAARSTHKRKRSAIRADNERGKPGGLGGGRLTLSMYEWSPSAREELKRALYTHPFNHTVDVLVPHTSFLTQNFISSLQRVLQNAGSGPCIAHVPLALFLEPTFVAQYIRTGSLYALSATWLDTQDSVCLDGQGMLVLSVTKDTYQQLGLVGRPSRFARGASGRKADRHSGVISRYIIELPLLDPSFIPGKRGYERAKQCLLAWDQARSKSSAVPMLINGVPASWSMLLVWTPPELTTTETPFLHGHRIWAPIEYAPLQQAHVMQALAPTLQMDSCTDVWIPPAPMLATSFESVPGDRWTSICEYLEWTGLASMRAPRLQTYDRCDPQIAMYAPISGSCPGAFLHVHIRGMLPPSLLSCVLDCMWDELDVSPRSAWASITVSGFSDSPIAWTSKYPGLGLALGSASSRSDAFRDGYNAAQRARKVRRKSHTRRGESEHGLFRTGENGWTMLLSSDRSQHKGHVALIDSVELDTHM